MSQVSTGAACLGNHKVPFFVVPIIVTHHCVGEPGRDRSHSAQERQPEPTCEMFFVNVNILAKLPKTVFPNSFVNYAFFSGFSHNHKRLFRILQTFCERFDDVFLGFCRIWRQT